MNLELRMKITQQIGFAVGYASMCWEPKPHGVFNSTQASEAVDHAMKSIDALLDVVEAANNLLSKGADHPTLPMLDLGSAVCKLEAVE